MDNLFIRVDASLQIGWGHLIRCFSLASMLRDLFQVEFIIKDEKAVFDFLKKENFLVHLIPSDVDCLSEIEFIKKIVNEKSILLLDGYPFDLSYQNSLKKSCNKLVCIDDVNPGKFNVDLIINHNVYAPLEKYCGPLYMRTCLGVDYALLRQEFFEAHSKKKLAVNKIGKILICMGGADVSGQTFRFLKVLSKLNNEKLFITAVVAQTGEDYQKIYDWVIKNHLEKNILLKTGLNARDISNEMIGNDLIVCPASVIALEACVVGIPMITGIIADNQIKNAKYLEDSNLAINFSWFKDIDADTLGQKIGKVIKDVDKLNEIRVNQKKIIKRNPKENLRQVFLSLVIQNESR